MSIEWVWWICAAVLVGAELLTGNVLSAGDRHRGGVRWRRRVCGRLAAGAVHGCRRPGCRADDGRAPAAARARRAAAATVARHRTGGARGGLESRRHRARELPRHELGRRARVARRRRAPRRSTSLPRGARSSSFPTAARRLTRSRRDRFKAGGIRHVARFVAVHDRTVRRRRHHHHRARSASCRSSTRSSSSGSGRFYAVLQPGLNFVIPFVDRVAYRHDLREIPFDVPSQICITKDNTQLQVDGILYFQVTDPRLASLRLEQLPGGDHPARADDAAQRDRPDGARPHVRGTRPHQQHRRRRRSTRRRRTGASRCCATRSRT